jgi:hypothetical protein
MAYWAAYQLMVARGRLSPEGALSVAFSSLVTASSRGRTTIEYEVPYRRFGLRGMGRQAADFVVTDSSGTRHVIELVRVVRSYNELGNELRRLKKIQERQPETQVWAVAVAQGKIPTKLVVKKVGTAVPALRIKNDGWPVRRVLKASGSFASTQAACYACIVEAVRSTV